jgi:hypothetical protein
MIYYVIIFVFNFFFNVFKTLEIKYTYENKIKALMFNSVYINLVSLASTFFSLDRLFEGDYLIIPFFIAGSVFGKWFAMKHVENIRYKVLQLLGKNNE